LYERSTDSREKRFNIGRDASIDESLEIGELDASLRCLTGWKEKLISET